MRRLPAGEPEALAPLRAGAGRPPATATGVGAGRVGRGAEAREARVAKFIAESLILDNLSSAVDKAQISDVFLISSSGATGGACSNPAVCSRPVFHFSIFFLIGEKISMC